MGETSFSNMVYRLAFALGQLSANLGTSKVSQIQPKKFVKLEVFFLKDCFLALQISDGERWRYTFV